MLRQEDCYQDGHPVAMIGCYTPTSKDRIATCSSQQKGIMKIAFDKFLGKKKYGEFNTFAIPRRSIINLLPAITKVFNFFEYQYDPEYELLTAYLEVKYIIDAQGGYASSIESIINIIYDTIFTDSICNKIRKMVQENYLDDIERGPNNKKVYAESLEFKNVHIRCLLAISTALKFIAPLAMHYIAQAKDRAGVIIDIGKGSDTLYYFYYPALKLFSDGCDIYNKIYVYVNKQVNISYKSNNMMFSQREIFGTTIPTVVNDLVRHMFIENNIIKYAFTETWDKKFQRYKETVVGLNHGTMQRQLMYFKKETYQATLASVGSAPSTGDDDMSGKDKMWSYLNYNNEGLAKSIEFGIRETTESLLYTNKLLVSNNDEILYYVDNWFPTDEQLQLIYAFYAKYYGDIKHCELLSKIDLTKLALILKKILLIDYIGGNEQSDDAEEGNGTTFNSAVLPYIITSNMIPNNSDKLVYSDELVQSIQDTYLYKIIMKKFAILIETIGNHDTKFHKHNNIIMELIINLLCSRYTLLDFYNQENSGKDIEFNRNRLSYELLSFITNI